MCGGTAKSEAACSEDKGLSPRVRGNPDQAGSDRYLDRSIPACAGEPDPGQAGKSQIRVYPRVCGGTLKANAVGHSQPGLSPRVRGNPPSLAATTESAGSIPACAGEPAEVSLGRPNNRVYPRVCGGTVETPSTHSPYSGLSPRVRGNR